MTEWARIRIAGRPAYQISTTDVLWAARAAVREGGSTPAALWTWAQRWASFGGRGSLASIIRAHSQPVNPLWLRSGACCCGTGRCPAAERNGRINFCGSEPCSRERTDFRAWLQSASWEQLQRYDAAAVRQTLAWAKALISNPVPRAVDFADPRVSEEFLRRNPDAKVVKKAGNWFIATGDTKLWEPDFVTLELDGRIAGPASIGIGTLVLIGGAGFAAYQWWRSRRH